MRPNAGQWSRAFVSATYASSPLLGQRRLSSDEYRAIWKPLGARRNRFQCFHAERSRERAKDWEKRKRRVSWVVSSSVDKVTGSPNVERAPVAVLRRVSRFCFFKIRNLDKV